MQTHNGVGGRNAFQWPAKSSNPKKRDRRMMTEKNGKPKKRGEVERKKKWLSNQRREVEEKGKRS